MTKNVGAKDHNDRQPSRSELAGKTVPVGGEKPQTAKYTNPGATKNLRGVEKNTQPHKGSPSPHQHGTEKGPVDEC